MIVSRVKLLLVVSNLVPLFKFFIQFSP